MDDFILRKGYTGYECYNDLLQIETTQNQHNTYVKPQNYQTVSQLKINSRIQRK